MTRVYILTASLIALLIVGTYLSLARITQTQQQYVAAINQSGRQRMLSQRITFLALQLTTAAEPGRRSACRRDLQATVDQMAAAHEALSRSSFTLGLPERSSSISALYFEPPAAIDLQVQAYLAHARALIAAPDSQLTLENSDFTAIIQAGSTTLLAALDDLVSRYEAEEIANVQTLYTAGAILLLMIAAAVLAVTCLIFRPMLRQIARTARDLLDISTGLDHAAIISIADQHGRLLDVNDKFCAISGYTRDELLGQNHQIVNSGYHSSEFFHDLRETTRQGRIWRGEIQNRARDGRLFWVDTTIVPLLGDARTPGRSLIIRFDITERKHSEEQLRFQKTLLECQSEASLDGILFVSTAGEWLHINRRLGEIWRIPEAIIATRSSQIALATVYDQLIDPQAFRAGLTYLNQHPNETGHAEIRFKDGRIFDRYSAPVRDAEGVHYGRVWYYRDVTEQRQKEAERARLAEILEVTPDLVSTATLDGSIQYVNRAGRVMLGLPAEGPLSPIAISACTATWSIPTIQAGIATALRDGSWSGEAALRGIDGREIPVSQVIVAHPEPGGRAPLISTIARDISDRKQIEASLQQAKEAAEAAAQARAAFLAMMSHEIRTPMNGVIGMTGLLLDTDLTAEQHEYAETVRRSGEALLTIINDILDFSKIEAGKLDLEMLDFDVCALIEDVVELLAESAERKNLMLGSLIAPDVPACLRGDPGRLRQVLTNLLSNAVKFTQQGEVLVRAELAGQDTDGVVLRLVVQDSGIGIAPEIQNRLFQPFTQADSSTTRLYGGTGLGLAISKQLVTLMGGTIGVASEPDKGATFTFSVRLGQPEEAEPAQPLADKLCGMRVLIVDDTPSSRALLTHLATAWGMESTAIAVSPSAPQILREAAQQSRPYDVAILDLVMPDLDGFALARAIKADPLIAGTPLVIITAYSQRGYAEQARRIGAAAFIAKPIRQSQLFDILVTILDGPTNTAIAASTAARQPRWRDSEAPSWHTAIRILVVEDNAVNQKVATQMLKKLGYQADVAANGIEALAAWDRIPYALILMDCHMPEMDGFTATAEIRLREGIELHTPIIALTANALAGERERCLAAGMDDYLPKPIRRDDLAATITHWLDLAGKRPDAQSARATATADTPPTLDMGTITQLRAMQDGNDMVAELRELLLDETTAGLHEIRAAIMAGDAAMLAQIAHTLKGSSSAIGAFAFAGLWAAAEQHGRAGTTAEAAALLEPLEAEFACVCAALDTVLGAIEEQ
jgi:PAS domain S-box-containing protein